MEEIEMTEPYFESLKRNLSGGIDGVYFNGQYPDGIPYGLDPSMGHIVKAEAGEWGAIEEPDQANKDAHEQAEAINQAVSSVQAMLDSEAAKRGYDNINAIAKYMGYDNQFRAECEALGAWCAACWAKCYELQAGGVMPDDLMAEMPVMVIS